MDDFDDLLGTTSVDAAENNLRIALKLVAQGIPVFPCREVAKKLPDGAFFTEKSPYVKGGFHSASADEDKVRGWWKKWPKALVGMPTGRASRIAVMDLDRHPDKPDGVKGLKSLGFKPEGLSNLYSTTAGNGIHLYFKWLEGVGNENKHILDGCGGIDVRGEGGYVIAPGSMFDDGRRYAEVDLSQVNTPFPEQFIAKRSSRLEGGETGSRFALGLSVDRIKEYMADLPNEGLGRDEWLKYIAALSHEAHIADEEGRVRPESERKAILQIALDWTASDPAYSSEEHLEKVRATFKTFRHSPHKKPMTMRSIVGEVNAIRLDRGVENEFDDLDDFEDYGDEDDGGDDFDDLLGTPEPKKQSKSQKRLAKESVEHALGKDAPSWVKRLNKKFGISIVSGKTVVLHFKANGRVDYGSVNDLHTFHENDRVQKDDTTVPVTKVWMQSKYRRTYPEGIIFAPNREVEGAYNHWQGFSVEPAEGRNPARGCRLFLKHLLEVVCDGNEEYYKYHLGWLAHMIQKPEEKPGVAVVYKGKKRIGKDTVFEYMGELFKNHYVTVANQDQMLGKFNQHQEKVLLLHMQEGFWAGNKQAEGMLKYLITSTSVMIEPKGVNAFPIPSVLRLFISSNERWVIPATEDEGRFFVLNVSEKRRNDHAYFAALREEMKGEGPSHLLAYLQQYDLTGFQVRKVPDTEALAEQKEMGLKNVERWWRDTLYRGHIDGIQNRENGVDNAVWSVRGVRIDKQEFRDNYSVWMRPRRFDGEEVSEVEFGLRMKRLCPSAVGKQVRGGGKRYMVYELPSLPQCRAEFEDYIGSAIAWPDDQLFVEQIEEEDDLG